MPCFLTVKTGHESSEGNKRRCDWWNVSSCVSLATRNVNFPAVPKLEYSSQACGWCDPSPSCHWAPLLHNSISVTPTGLRQRWMLGWIDRETRAKGLVIDCILVRKLGTGGLAWGLEVPGQSSFGLLVVIPSLIHCHQCLFRILNSLKQNNLFKSLNKERFNL